MRSDVRVSLHVQQHEIIIQHKYKCHEKKRNKKAGKGYFGPDVLQSEERKILQEDPGGREDALSICEQQRSDGENFCKEDSKETVIEESVKSESGQADWYFLPAPILPEPILPKIETKTPKKKTKKRKRCTIS